MRPFAASVLENEPLGGDVFLMKLWAPDAARNCRPGQFIHLRCGPLGGHDPLLRRAFWVMRAEGDMVAVRYRVVGRGTLYLSRLRVGDAVDVLGPLGRPFQLPSGARHLLLLGRESDVSPLVMLSDTAIARELEVVLVVGFDTEERALAAELVGAAVEYRVAIGDEGLDQPGSVSALAAELLPWADAVYVAGAASGLGQLLDGTSKPAQIALGAWHGCATGVCFECVVRTRHGSKRACRDGPVFRWGELR